MARSLKQELLAALVAIVVLTAALGVLYPLAVTGVAQVAFPHAANGSQVKVEGKVVGSSLLGQDFKRARRYFQSRPSADGYDPSATAFSNAGPNSAQLRDEIAKRAAAYLALERPYDPRLTLAQVPPDAVQTSGSGLDPQISVTNARIQAHRVAAVRGLPLARVDQLVHAHTDGRSLGLFGEPGVNVLQLNIALDEEAGR